MKKTILQLLIITATFLTITLAMPMAANALTNTPYIPQPGTLPGPTEEFQRNSGGSAKALVTTLIPRFTAGSVGIAAAFATLFLIIGGVRYAISYGKDESIENAKKQIIYALVGLFLALLAYTIVIIIINLKFVEDNGL